MFKKLIMANASRFLVHGVIAFILLTNPITANDLSDTSEIFQRPVEGRRLTDCLISKHIVTNLFECAYWCVVKNCLSLNYGRADGNVEEVYTCELNNCIKEDRQMLVSQGVDYYELMNEKEVPQCHQTETPAESTFALYFPGSNSEDYVKISDQGFHELRAFTICAWVKFFDKANGTIVSYFAPGSTNEISIYFYSHHVMFAVKDHWKWTETNISHGSWHALCLTWSSVNGEIRVYQDKVLTDVKTGVRTGQKITRGGNWTLGRDLADAGEVPIYGKLIEVNVWGCVLPAEDIAKLSTDCKTGMNGDIKRWTQFSSGARGSVLVVLNADCN